MLKAVTAADVALTMSGSHGEFAGVAMILAYHRTPPRGSSSATKSSCLGGAGTKPRAPRPLCGWLPRARRFPVDAHGDVELTALGCRGRSQPSASASPTLHPRFVRRHTGRFRAHRAPGACGLLYYYCWRNLTAISCKVRPWDMASMSSTLNRIQTSHPPRPARSRSVSVGRARLAPFGPIPLVVRTAISTAGLRKLICRGPSGGCRLHGYTGVLLACLIHAPAWAGGHAARGRLRHAHATTCSHSCRPRACGRLPPAPRGSHEFIVTLTSGARTHVTRHGLRQATARTMASRAATYFPLLVPMRC